MFEDNIAPIPKPDVDFSSLSAQPTPEQYFLLSRINGELTVAELCRVSGLPKDQTLAELEQLVEYGLIEIPDDGGGASEEDVSAESPAASDSDVRIEDAEEGPVRMEYDEHGFPIEDRGQSGAESEPQQEEVGDDEASETPGSTDDEETREAVLVDEPEQAADDASSSSDEDEAASRPSAGVVVDEQSAASSAAEEKADKSKPSRSKSRKKGVTPNYPVPPSDYDFDEDLLSLDIPLDDEQRRQALCLYGQLDEMTFYDLFGVEPDASRRDIKRAYFRLSKRYHPDKFFRKELHEFAEVLERIFQEITKAYRILSNRKKREEYDKELEPSEDGSGQTPSPAAASSLAEHSSRAFEDKDEEERKRKKNKKAAAAMLLVRRAEKLIERGEYERAASEYRKALALKREPDMAIRVARMLDEEGGHPEEAISFARAALKLDPRNIEARVLLSELYDKTGRADDALKHLEKAARLDPSNQEIQEKLSAMRAEQN